MITRLQFELERLLLRGVLYRLLVAVAIIVGVALIGGMLVLMFDPQFEDFGGAVWWAFLRLTDPGYLGDDEGTVSRSVSTIITVLGYILFLGLLIAILTQWMNEWIQRVEAGTSKLKIRNHILILGWNHRTPSIVLELLRTRARVTRFLKTHDASVLRIVILAEDVNAALRNRLQTELGEYWDDRRIIIRSGNSLQIDGLERASFRTAASIILPGADFAIAQPGVSDAEIVKALASISYHESKSERLPPVVAAIYNSNRRKVAEAAFKGSLEVVEADRTIARLVAQSVLEPGLWRIYSELLTINEGNALFVRTVPPAVNGTFGGLRSASAHALPIGVVDASRRVHLNPPSGRVVTSGDELVYVSRRYEDCEVRLAEAEHDLGDGAIAFTAANSRPRRILVLGWSRKVPLLVQELLSYPDRVQEIVLAGITPIAERESALGVLDHDKVSHVEANFLDPYVLEGLGCGGYDNVIIVARERLGGEAVADAATLSAYLELEAVIEETDRPRVLVEVLEEENHPLFDRVRDDVVLSPVIVSFILSQVALKPDLGRVFRELVQPTGTFFALRQIADVAASSVLSYGTVAAAARKRGELAIGIVAPAVDDGRLLLNPPGELTWSHDSRDRVVVLTAPESGSV